MSDKTDERIPTLTNIVKAGDPSMENHFDGHFIEDIKDTKEADSTRLELDQHTTNDLIDELIHTSLPIIEEQLRNRLSDILNKYTKNDIDD